MTPAPSRASLAKWLLGLLVAVGLAATVARLDLAAAALGAVERLRAMGPAGMLPFALTYAVLSVLLVPVTPFSLSAGFLYGPVAGFFTAWGGEVLGACLAYAAGRWVFRERARALIARSPMLAALDDALEAQGWRLLVLVRLSPLFPFGPLNYALGFSGVRPSHYVVSTAVGVAPACLLLVWTGSTLPHLQAVLEGEQGMEGAWLYWSGLVATAVAVVAVTRATRQALQKRLGT